MFVIPYVIIACLIFVAACAHELTHYGLINGYPFVLLAAIFSFVVGRHVVHKLRDEFDNDAAGVIFVAGLFVIGACLYVAAGVAHTVAGLS